MVPRGVGGGLAADAHHQPFAGRDLLMVSGVILFVAERYRRRAEVHALALRWGRHAAGRRLRPANSCESGPWAGSERLGALCLRARDPDHHPAGIFSSRISPDSRATSGAGGLPRLPRGGGRRGRYRPVPSRLRPHANTHAGRALLPSVRCRDGHVHPALSGAAPCLGMGRCSISPASLRCALLARPLLVGCEDSHASLNRH